MQTLQKDPLSPATKDPAEGARDANGSAEASAPIEEGHLGRGGDPVEGRDDEDAAGPAPA
jgi:hypothetical protein